MPAFGAAHHGSWAPTDTGSHARCARSWTAPLPPRIASGTLPRPQQPRATRVASAPIAATAARLAGAGRDGNNGRSGASARGERTMKTRETRESAKDDLTWAMLGLTMLGLVAFLGVLDRRTRDQYDARRWHAGERQICAVTS